MEFTKITSPVSALVIALSGCVLSGCATPDQYDASTHVWCTFQDSVNSVDPDITEEVFPGSRFQDQDQTDHCIYQNSSSYEEQRKRLQKTAKR